MTKKKFKDRKILNVVISGVRGYFKGGVPLVNTVNEIRKNVFHKKPIVKINDTDVEVETGKPHSWVSIVMSVLGFATMVFLAAKKIIPVETLLDFIRELLGMG